MALFLYYIGRNAQIAAITIVGSIFATLTVFPQKRLTPTQKISIEPVRDRLCKAASVMNGSMNLANKVTLPCRIATGMAEKIQPFPIAAVMTATMIKSKTAFAAKME